MPNNSRNPRALKTIKLVFSDIDKLEYVYNNGFKLFGYSATSDDINKHKAVDSPRIVQCFKCFKFDHSSSNCNLRESKCSVCGEFHHYSECQRKDTPVCLNCGKGHHAASNVCKFRRDRIKKLIEDKKAKENSYNPNPNHQLVPPVPPPNYWNQNKQVHWPILPTKDESAIIHAQLITRWAIMTTDEDYEYRDRFIESANRACIANGYKPFIPPPDPPTNAFYYDKSGNDINIDNNDVISQHEHNSHTEAEEDNYLGEPGIPPSLPHYPHNYKQENKELHMPQLNYSLSSRHAQRNIQYYDQSPITPHQVQREVNNYDLSNNTQSTVSSPIPPNQERKEEEIINNNSTYDNSTIHSSVNSQNTACSVPQSNSSLMKENIEISFSSDSSLPILHIPDSKENPSNQLIDEDFDKIIDNLPNPRLHASKGKLCSNGNYDTHYALRSTSQGKGPNNANSQSNQNKGTNQGKTINQSKGK